MDTSDEATFWERAAQTRWGRYLTHAELEALEEGLRLAGGPGRALEIGAEGGRWSKLLADRGWSLICTDVDAEALEVCRSRIPKAACILVDPQDTVLPSETGTVGLVLAYEVAPVVQSAWFPAEAARVLEPGGILICSFYNSFSIRAIAYRILCLVDNHRRRYGGDYYRGGSYAAFAAKLAEAGLQPVKAVGLGWFPLTRQSNSPLVPLLSRLERAFGLRRWVRASPFVLVIARHG